MQKPAKILDMLKRAVPLLLLVSLAALCVVSFRWKAAEHERAQAIQDMQAAVQERDLLQEENRTLLNQQENTDEQEASNLFHDLEKNPQLIPISAELGGTMRYYQDTFALFGERYAYAYAEDGHNAVEMLLQYEKYSDGAVAWTLCAYNAGGGWQTD